MLERSGAETMSLEISTILKLAMLAVDKYSLTSKQPGFITVQNGKKIKVRFEELSHALGDLLNKDLAIVRRCKDCENWSYAPKTKRGVCFPKEYSCTRKPEDFCSFDYVYRSKERRERDAAINRLTQKE